MKDYMKPAVEEIKFETEEVTTFDGNGDTESNNMGGMN